MVGWVWMTGVAHMEMDCAGGGLLLHPLGSAGSDGCGGHAESASGGSSVVPLAPLRDYTPPENITLLFTDLGILTPAAVSDELIQLYL